MIISKRILTLIGGGVLVGAILVEAPHLGHSKVDRLMLKMDLPALTKASDLIVRGTVEKKIGTIRKTDDSGEDMVYTRWRVAVDSPLKGAAKKVIVRTAGGQYLSTIVDVEDEAVLVTGRNMMMFLKKDAESTDYVLTGSFQGAYEVAGESAVQAVTKNQVSLSDLTSEINRALNSK